MDTRYEAVILTVCLMLVVAIVLLIVLTGCTVPLR